LAEELLEAMADLRAKVADDSEGPHTEPVEGETHVVVTMRAAPEVAESDVALATTLQECCLM